MSLVGVERLRERGFCCGGGDISPWHDIEQEDMRMGENALKADGFEAEMKVIDLMAFRIPIR
jgi:hypothetical protein